MQSIVHIKLILCIFAYLASGSSISRLSPNRVESSEASGIAYEQAQH